MAIEEELELNIEKALEAVELFAAQFEQAIATFSNTLAQSLSEIFASPLALQAQLDLDPGDSSEVVQGAIGDEQTTSVTFEDTNASDVGEEVQSELSSTVPPPISVPLEGEDSGLSDVVSEALTPEVEDVVLPVEADLVNGEEEAQELEDYFTNIDAMVTPTVDLTEVENARDEIESADAEFPLSVDEAEVDKLKEVASSTAEAGSRAKEAEKDVAGFEKALAGLGVAAFTAAGALTAAFAVASGLFSSAVEAQGALVGFNKQLGDLAPAIRNIDVQGLNIDLAELAQSLGSSDEAVLQVAQRFALLGQTSGAANDVIAEANSNLFGVATAIRAVNPSMGELDQIASSLANGFQRGGTALARLGVNITSAEIRFRAAQTAAKPTTAEFSRFELAAAGAALAAEKFGSSISSNFEDALENPQIALERFKEIFADTLEAIGAPLIVPFLEVIEKGIPVVTGLTSTIADLALAALPAVNSVIDAFVPLAETFIDVASKVFSDLEPAFTSLGNSFEAILNNLVATAPLWTLLVEIFAGGLSEAVLILSEFIEGLVDGLGDFGLAILGLIPILLNFEKILAANKIGLAVTAVIGLLGAVKKFGAETPDEPFQNVVDSAFEAAEGVDGLLEALSKYSDAIASYVEEKQVLENPELVRALAEEGITVDQFTEALKKGERGLYDIIRAAPDAGFRFFTSQNKEINADAESMDRLSEGQMRALASSQSLRGNAKILRDEYDRLSGSINASDEQAFNLIVTQNNLGKTWRDWVVGLSELQDGSIDWAKALEHARLELEAQQRAQLELEEATASSAEQNQEFAENMSLLAVQVAAGTIGLSDLAAAAEIAGFEGEELSNAIQQLTDEVGAFVDSAVSKVPSVTDAFSALNDETSAQQIIANFDEQIAATETWNANMLRLRDEGQTDILRLVAELGPEQGNLLLAQYQDNETELAAHLQRMYQAEQDAKVAVREVAVLSWLELRGITGTEAAAVVEELRSKLTLADATEEAIIDAADAAAVSSPILAAELADGVTQNIDALIVTSAEELTAKGAELNEAIGAVWDGAGGVAESASKVASEKAVEVFNNVVKTGFLDVATVEAIVGRATAAMTSGGFAAGLALAQGMLGGITVGAVSVSRKTGEVVEGVQDNVAASAFMVGRNLGEEIIDGMLFDINNANADGVVSEKMSDLLKAVTDRNIEVARESGNSLGNALIQGMERGLTSGFSSVSRLAANIIAAAETAARNEAESDSPSKAWERLGRDLVAGLSKGLDGASAISSRSAVGVVEGANGAAGSVTNSNISVTVPVTINGDADPSVGRQIGQAAAAELRSVLRLEARVS